MITKKSSVLHFFRKRSGSLHLISLFAALLTLELATRFFRPDHLNKVQFDPEIGYLLRPHLRVTITDRESRVTHELRANSLGFRGSEWVVPKPQGVKRVAVLGDSYVEARAFELERVFCGRLQRLLNESSSTDRWEVMNLGVPGHNTSSELAVYQKFVQSLDPDIVILCVTLSNDLGENLRELSDCFCVYQEFDEEGRATVIPPQRKTDRDVKSHSQFYVWQKAKMQTAIDRFRNTNALSGVIDPLANTRKKKLDEARCITKVPLDEPYARAWTVTRKLLEIFRNQVEEQGSRFYVVSIPNAWQVHENLFDMMRNEEPDPEAFDIDQPIDQLANITDRLGIDLLELTPAFRDELAEFKRTAPGESGEDLLFLNGVGHFTERAHQLVARELFRYLKSNETPASSLQTDQLAEQPNDSTTLRN